VQAEEEHRHSTHQTQCNARSRLQCKAYA
jgi:hypothetical protein